MCAENVVWTLLISSFLTFWFLYLSQTFLFIRGTNGFHDSILKATERGIFCFNMYLFLWLHQVLVAWHRPLSSCCCRLSSCGLWPWLPHNTWDLIPRACMSAKLLQSSLTICNPMDCSPPGSSVHGILQARILEKVAMPSSRAFSRPRDWTRASYVSYTGRQTLYSCETWEATRSQTRD